jgi:hypothetical protein
MQLNLKKLDARIQKLQEIKRIAADPELVSMLLEFIVNEEDRIDTAPKPNLVASLPSQNDMELVDHVLKGMEPQPNGTWTVKRT